MIYVISCIVMVLLDQASKYYAKTVIRSSGSIAVIKGFFHLTYLENRGAAFGMLQGQRVIFTIMTVLIIAIILSYVSKNKGSIALKWIATFIIAGAIGNLIDRLLLGYVVDFIDFRGIWSYVFNVADMFVVCGAFAMALRLLLEEKATKKIRE
ncbi:signal peptidase II [Filifactor villosus]|uniref:Lipoprotein signal peptidase n=1 Tax=Filifactor villosus TaxID=29374 RepID=A0ABV9QMD7_9FIRM